MLFKKFYKANNLLYLFVYNAILSIMRRAGTIRVSHKDTEKFVQISFLGHGHGLG